MGFMEKFLDVRYCIHLEKCSLESRRRKAEGMLCWERKLVRLLKGNHQHRQPKSIDSLMSQMEPLDRCRVDSMLLKGSFRTRYLI